MHFLYSRFIKSMGRDVLDRTKNQFSDLGLEALKACQPPIGAPFDEHVAWHTAVAKIVGTKPRVHLSVSVGDAYENFGSADCSEGTGL
jgi:hypothetical protein